MAVEAFIDARIYGGDSKDFYDHPLSMGKRTVLDYLAALRCSGDTGDQRVAFEAMGHHPLDFDTISRCATDHYGTTQLPDDFDDSDEEDQPVPLGSADFTTPTVEDTVQMRLFLTEDLNEVEQWVWWLKYAGYTNAEVADRVPWDVLLASDYAADYLRTGDVAVKVSRIHSRAAAKAEKFEIQS